jgi:hypothetical protein
MIIGINGKIGSGKDTIGKIIQYLTYPVNVDIQTYLEKEVNGQFEIKPNVHTVPNFEIKKFAGKLKTTASLLTGIPVEMFEDQEFKKLDMNPEWGMTYREFLQRLGTEAMRDGLHTNVWVNALFADYIPTPNKSMDESFMEQFVTGNSEIHYALPKWIITDMRFPNELDAVKEKEGITIRVVRQYSKEDLLKGSSPCIRDEELSAKLAQRYKSMADLPVVNIHPSETALDDAEFDYEIINDGTLEDLVEKVRQILIKEKLI